MQGKIFHVFLCNFQYLEKQESSRNSRQPNIQDVVTAFYTTNMCEEVLVWII